MERHANSSKSGITRPLTRRSFLTSAGSMAAAIALGRVVRAGNLSGSITIGSGEHTYECVHDWITPPSHIKFGDTQGLAQDAFGRIYVAHTVHPESQSKDAIAVFDEYGRFLDSWGARFQGGAHGLDIRQEGAEQFLYHCDTAHRQVVKTRLNGDVMWEMGAPVESDLYNTGAPFIPTNVAFSPNGEFYVTDGYGSDWIHRYTRNAELLQSFGGKGSDAGFVLNAHGIWVDNRGREPFLVVADRGNSRLQYFTLDGRHVKFSNEGMRKPCHADLRGNLTLIPDLSSVVTLLDEAGKVVVQLGDGDPSNLRGAPRDRFIPGKFIHPHDAIFLRNGDILVAEWVPIGRITLLRKIG
jgi:hypothetical protein